jgi:beta-lactamase superfamily II metal-dependent hydrolase
MFEKKKTEEGRFFKLCDAQFVMLDTGQKRVVEIESDDNQVLDFIPNRSRAQDGRARTGIPTA